MGILVVNEDEVRTAVVENICNLGGLQTGINGGQYCPRSKDAIMSICATFELMQVICLCSSNLRSGDLIKTVSERKGL